MNNKVIERYDNKLNSLKTKCLNISEENEFKDLFKGIFIMLIRNILELKNKLSTTVSSNINSKLSELNILLDYLENDNQLINIDICDILLRGYVSYFYQDYRDYIMNWDIDKIKYLDNNIIKDTIVSTVAKEKDITDMFIKDDITEYLNIIPEISIMINNLEMNDIIKLFYLLNNLNIIIDIYLLKRNQ
jgi:hypothetical protein